MTTDPDERDTNLSATRPGDELPIPVTRYQALKCAAIITAFTQGQVGWEPHVQKVAHFLMASAMEVTHGKYAISPNSEEDWHDLNELPWPQHGGPRPQQ